MSFDPAEIPYPPRVWAYTLADGWHIWAGRTSQDNDKLSLRIARNDDWWFHVKGSPGSHVVLFVRDGLEPPKDVVKAAASVAAWHSKQRNGGQVAVNATRARHVNKPRGAKPGLVTIRKEVTLKVRPGVPGPAPDDHRT